MAKSGYVLPVEKVGLVSSAFTRVSTTHHGLCASPKRLMKDFRLRGVRATRLVALLLAIERQNRRFAKRRRGQTRAVVNFLAFVRKRSAFQFR
jgi:hypothetical protein